MKRASMVSFMRDLLKFHSTIGMGLLAIAVCLLSLDRGVRSRNLRRAQLKAIYRSESAPKRIRNYVAESRPLIWRLLPVIRARFTAIHDPTNPESRDFRRHGKPCQAVAKLRISTRRISLSKRHGIVSRSSAILSRNRRKMGKIDESSKDRKFINKSTLTNQSMLIRRSIH